MPIIRSPDHPYSKYVQIPIDLIKDKNLSAKALAVVTFIMAQGFEGVNIKAIQDRFQLKDYSWRAISRELRENNVLELVKKSRGTQLIFKY